MVCRENKARSAVIGLEKHLLAAHNNGRREPDHVFQSSIHEYGHAFEGVKNPTPQEYQEFLVGFRQQVINSEKLSDAEKYRQSHKQPGIVTRIDQELERVRSGKDENGRPLRTEQMNGGKHFASMQRMSTLLNRQVQARNAYVENYARQTGRSVPDATARWDRLCARSPEERENTKISLKDNWQRDLKVAGLTSQHQADLMQSNVARDAVAVMEHERRLKVATLPSRPTITDENRVKAITTEEAKNRVRCESCGQFGHEDPQCPHHAAFDRLNDAHIARIEAAEQYENLQQQNRKAVIANAALEGRAAVHPVGHDGNDRGWVYIDGEKACPLDEAVLSRSGINNLIGRGQAARRSGTQPHTDDLLPAVDLAGEEQARKENQRASRDLDKVRAEYEAARGPEPLVSDAVTEVGYDKNTGLLEVTRPGYTRKRDGVTVDPKRYYYRMSPDQYDDMMASGSVGKYLAGSVGSKEHESYKWENEAEAREATMQRQCPSCGQWASMTSAHQCPAPGSMDSTEEAHYRERVRVARERAADEGLPVEMRTATRRRQILAQSHAQLPQGGVARFPEVSQMSATRHRGEVGSGPVTVQYLGATVNGKAHTWNDPGTGQPYTTMSQLSCSCGARGTCQHREHAGNVVAAAYRSHRVVKATPGQRMMRDRDDGNGQIRGTSLDAPDGPIARQSYQRIREERAAARGQLEQAWAGHPNWRARATAPLSAETGQPVPVPRTYRMANGEDLDVTRSESGASAAIGMMLSERSDSGVQLRSTGDGTGRITMGPMRLDRDGHMAYPDRVKLGSLLGLSGAAPREGVYVPDDPSWRYEMLSRAEKGKTDILGSRYVADKGQAYGPAV